MAKTKLFCIELRTRTKKFSKGDLFRVRASSIEEAADIAARKVSGSRRAIARRDTGHTGLSGIFSSYTPSVVIGGYVQRASFKVSVSSETLKALVGGGQHD